MTAFRSWHPEIQNKLGPGRKLTFKFEELHSYLSNMEEDSLYLQGFTDCVYLLKLIRVI